jgi:hypothetical protein
VGYQLTGQPLVDEQFYVDDAEVDLGGGIAQPI